MTRPLKTIIVDDEALARRGLKHRLSAHGDIDLVAEARNGREAVELIREHRPDLIFLDIQMPGMDGFDVLRTLPAEDRLRHRLR
jgi:two-component system LytT family response regulator